MAASLRILAIMLALPALYAAFPIQPDFSTLPLTMNMRASDSKLAAPTGFYPIAHTAVAATIPTLTLKLTARTTLSIQPSVTAAATNTAVSAQEQSSWNSGVISTVVFGCIASILGVLAIWATVWLGRRQTKHATRSIPDADASQARQPNSILEDIPIGPPSSHDSNTNSDSGPTPTDPARVPWGISPRGTGVMKDGTNTFEAPPPAYVSPNVRV